MLAAAFAWLVIGLLFGSLLGLQWAQWLDGSLPVRVNTRFERLQELREEVKAERATRDLIRLQIEEAEALQAQVNGVLGHLACDECKRSAPEVIAEALQLERKALAVVDDTRCEHCGRSANGCQS